jgi:hypothetical protein
MNSKLDLQIHAQHIVIGGIVQSCGFALAPTWRVAMMRVSQKNGEFRLRTLWAAGSEDLKRYGVEDDSSSQFGLFFCDGAMCCGLRRQYDG